MLDAMLDEVRELAGGNGDHVQLAREGMELDLTSP